MSDKKTSQFLQESTESWFQTNIVSNAPQIIGIFANLVVVVADVRAYDVVYGLTGVWWKALLASLACAIPFILWELGWQYNHTTDGWRVWSLLMAGLAFATSMFLGVADYLEFVGEWTDFLLGSVVVLTGVHTVMFFLYYYNDPDVIRKRKKSQALAKMEDQNTNAEMTKFLLERGDNLLDGLKTLEAKYGPDEVANIMAILQGKKPPKN